MLWYIQYQVIYIIYLSINYQDMLWIKSEFMPVHVHICWKFNSEIFNLNFTQCIKLVKTDIFFLSIDQYTIKIETKTAKVKDELEGNWKQYQFYHTVQNNLLP